MYVSVKFETSLPEREICKQVESAVSLSVKCEMCQAGASAKRYTHNQCH